MRPIAILLVVAFLSACGDRPADDPTADPPAEALTGERATAIRDSLRGFLAAYSASVERGDWDAVGALYSEDPGFVWIEDGRVAYDSAAEVRASLAGMAGVIRSARTEFHSIRVLPLAPGLATISSEFRHTFAMEGGDDLELTGALTATVAHEEGGWRFLSGHTSTLDTEEDP